MTANSPNNDYLPVLYKYVLSLFHFPGFLLQSAESQCNEIERILAEDTASSHFGTSFLDSPSPCGQWTRDEEDALARLLRENGKQWNNIAKRLNRTAIEVKAHARKLLLTESFTSPKPDKERPNEQKNRLKLTSAKRPPPAKSVQGHGAITRSGFVRLDSRGRRLRRGNAVTALSFDDEEPSSSKRPMKKALVDAGEFLFMSILGLHIHLYIIEWTKRGLAIEAALTSTASLFFSKENLDFFLSLYLRFFCSKPRSSAFFFHVLMILF